MTVSLCHEFLAVSIKDNADSMADKKVNIFHVIAGVNLIL